MKKLRIGKLEIRPCYDIVSFYLKENDKIYTLYGIFSFNMDTLRYEIDIYSLKYDLCTCLSYEITVMRNFKIIGNILNKDEIDCIDLNKKHISTQYYSNILAYYEENL